MNTHPISAVML